MVLFTYYYSENLTCQLGYACIFLEATFGLLEIRYTASN